MKNNITELVFILDRSGSMSGLESDTIGGFNSMLRKQKGEPGEAFVTTVLFDTRFERKHDRVKLEDVPELTAHDYIPGGCTALLDAIGDTIRHIVNIHRYAREEDVPEKTVFAIMTDGMENASHRFTRDEVKRMIEHEQEKYGWEFLFLGANIDAVQTAGGIGRTADDGEVRIGRGFDPFQDLALHEGGVAAEVQVETAREGLRETQAGFSAVARHDTLVVIRGLDAHDGGIQRTRADEDVATLLIEHVGGEVEAVRNPHVGSEVGLVGGLLPEIGRRELRQESAPGAGEVLAVPELAV